MTDEQNSEVEGQSPIKWGEPEEGLKHGMAEEVEGQGIRHGEPDEGIRWNESEEVEGQPLKLGMNDEAEGDTPRFEADEAETEGQGFRAGEPDEVEGQAFRVERVEKLD